MTMRINGLAPDFAAATIHVQFRFYALLGGSASLPAQLWNGSNFTIRRSTGVEPGTVIFHLSGPFTARDMYSSLTPAALQNLLDSSKQEPGTRHIFDLTHVPYMDSAALSVLVNHIHGCKGNGIHCALTGANARVLQLLKKTRTDTFVPVGATIDAINAGSQAN